MSFSNQLKNQLVETINEQDCCKVAELAGLIKMDGIVLISEDGRVLLEFISENLNIARRTLELIRETFQVNTTISVKRSNRLKKNIFYIIRIPSQEKVSQLLYTLGMEQDGMLYTTVIKEEFLEKECCRKSYLRGIFLGAGYISNPENDYHLEIVTKSEAYAEQLLILMNKMGLEPKYIVRNYQVVVYVKEIDQIISFLHNIGGEKSAVQVNEVKRIKQLRNDVNRSVNCETANMNKTIDAAIRQIDQIKQIDRLIGLESLSLNLRELARIRQEYPNLSLKELGEIMNPPLSKSAVNHRMRRIEAIAEKISVST